MLKLEARFWRRTGPGVSWFTFYSAEEYRLKVDAIRVRTGADALEDGEIVVRHYSDAIDAVLAKALNGLLPENVATFLERTSEWDTDEKVRVAIWAGEMGELFDLETDDPNDLDVTYYEDMTTVELAREFVDEGLFGDIPEHLEPYLDFEAIARDLRHDYTEAEIGGRTIIYRSV